MREDIDNVQFTFLSIGLEAADALQVHFASLGSSIRRTILGSVAAHASTWDLVTGESCTLLVAAFGGKMKPPVAFIGAEAEQIGSVKPRGQLIALATVQVAAALGEAGRRSEANRDVRKLIGEVHLWPASQLPT